jgi:hypothetical protein
LHTLDEGKDADNLEEVVEFVQKAYLIQVIDGIEFLPLVDGLGHADIITFSSLPRQPTNTVSLDLF